MTTTTDQTTTKWAVLTEHPRDPATATLTATQQSALDTLRTGRRGLWPDAPYRQRTLNALVLAGHAVWRGTVFETPCRHGVMPHVVLLDRQSSGSVQHWIETGLYLTRDEAAEYATEPVDDSLVAALRALALAWQHEAANTRPGNGQDDYMLDGFDDVENEATADTLEDCSSRLLALLDAPR